MSLSISSIIHIFSTLHALHSLFYCSYGTTTKAVCSKVSVSSVWIYARSNGSRRNSHAISHIPHHEEPNTCPVSPSFLTTVTRSVLISVATPTKTAIHAAARSEQFAPFLAHSPPKQNIAQEGGKTRYRAGRRLKELSRTSYKAHTQAPRSKSSVRHGEAEETSGKYCSNKQRIASTIPNASHSKRFAFQIMAATPCAMQLNHVSRGFKVTPCVRERGGMRYSLVWPKAEVEHYKGNRASLKAALINGRYAVTIDSDVDILHPGSGECL